MRYDTIPGDFSFCLHLPSDAFVQLMVFFKVNILAWFRFSTSSNHSSEIHGCVHRMGRHRRVVHSRLDSDSCFSSPLISFNCSIVTNLLDMAIWKSCLTTGFLRWTQFSLVGGSTLRLTSCNHSCTLTWTRYWSDLQSPSLHRAPHYSHFFVWWPKSGAHQDVVQNG